jgi:hypothetical protein
MGPQNRIEPKPRRGTAVESPATAAESKRSRTRPTRRGVGRPTSYSPTVAKALCVRLGAGELLIDICSEAGMPRLGTLFAWREQFPEFQAMYARAGCSKGMSLPSAPFVRLVKPLPRQRIRRGSKWTLFAGSPQSFCQKSTAIELNMRTCRQHQRECWSRRPPRRGTKAVGDRWSRHRGCCAPLSPTSLVAE